MPRDLEIAGSLGERGCRIGVGHSVGRAERGDAHADPARAGVITRRGPSTAAGGPSGSRDRCQPARNTVTELPSAFATQTCPPPTATETGYLKW